MPSNTDGLAVGRVARHDLFDRLYHWTVAASVLILMFTAFLPILGVKFEWVTIHWIAGIVLTVAVLCHIVRAVFFQDVKSMLVWIDDIRDAWIALSRFFGGGAPPPEKPGKYPLLQKLYHMGIVVFILGLIVSGALMLAKIDTPWWRRNPYFIENSMWGVDATWGIIYAVHGFCAMATLSMVMIHVYFAFRPEKLWITRSMILGWITTKEYLTYHSPRRWAAKDADTKQPVRIAERAAE